MMNKPSLILRTTGFFLMPLLFLFSIFLFLRGHNESGGGFIAGLVAAAAVALHLFFSGIESAKKLLGFDPRDLMGAGLLLALVSGFISMIYGKALFTAIWGTVNLPILGKVKLGTPLLFDLGVYFVVIGAVLGILLSLAEAEE